MLEAWLKNVTILQERSPSTSTEYITDTSHPEQNYIYIERSEKLKRFSIPKFHRWRMKHHHQMVVQCVHSTEEMTRQHKRQRSCNKPIE